MKRFDIELLLVFDEIYKTRNVTRAAENLALPQSTVSLGLARLREHFNDRLFTRTVKGMAPTPRAENAIADVRLALQALQHALLDEPGFDPGGSTRKFRICMTDISEIVLLPRLLNHLREHGTGIQLEISKISPDSPLELADGRVDLAVGFMPHLEAGFYQQKLFTQHFVCLVANGHPRVRDALSLEALQREHHVLVRTSGTGHAIVDKVLAREGIERRAALHLPSFLGVARIVAQTELLAIVPYRYGVVMAESEDIRLLPTPVELPSFEVKQHWHERYHADGSNQWLRHLIARLFGGDAVAGAAPPSTATHDKPPRLPVRRPAGSP